MHWSTKCERGEKRVASHRPNKTRGLFARDLEHESVKCINFFVTYLPGIYHYDTMIELFLSVPTFSKSPYEMMSAIRERFVQTFSTFNESAAVVRCKKLIAR